MSTNSDIFLSYNRNDHPIVAIIAKTLENDGINVWFDDKNLLSGCSWQKDMEQGLKSTKSVAVFIGANGLGPWEEMEMRAAIVESVNRGIPVIPILLSGSPEISALPPFLKSYHCVDMRKGVNEQGLDHLKCGIRGIVHNNVPARIGIPFMAEGIPDGFVERHYEFKQSLELLISGGGNSVMLTTALRGAGGFGKTWLATFLCHEPRVKASFPDGILWVTLGENPQGFESKVAELIQEISGENFNGSLRQSRIRLRDLLKDRKYLLVLDDLWYAEHLTPFQEIKYPSVRLITTRNRDLLPPDSKNHEVFIDAMKPEEARAVLSWKISQLQGHEKEMQNLTNRLGFWPQLLAIVNRELRFYLDNQGSLKDALNYINRSLDKEGLFFFDNEEAEDRTKAAAATIRLSTNRLSSTQMERFFDLAIFCEDTDIPIPTVARLYHARSGWSLENTKNLAMVLANSSLLFRLDLSNLGRIRLHDVIRQFLRKERKKEIASLNQVFLETYQLNRWADMTEEESYLWKHLIWHFLEAKRKDLLRETVCDPKYLIQKSILINTMAVESDLREALRAFPGDTQLECIEKCFRNITHLLNRTKNPKERFSCLINRFIEVKELKHLVTTWDTCI